MIWFALGILLGGSLGMLLMGVLTSNRSSDTTYRIYYENADQATEDIYDKSHAGWVEDGNPTV